MTLPSNVARATELSLGMIGDPFAPLTGSSAGDLPIALLRLPTSDGSGQACHPSVVLIPDGFGPDEHRYWMANTPYPHNRHDLENPEVFSSREGLLWHVPAGAKNPVVAGLSTDPRRHHSDPCLVWHDGRLILYFRTSDVRGRVRRDSLSRMISVDGRSWSAPVTVLDDATGRLLLSPAVQIFEGQFHLWTVDAVPGMQQLSLVCRCSDDGCCWSEPRAVTLIWPDEARFEPWHVDVVQHDGVLVAAGSAREPGRSGSQRFFSAIGDVPHQRWRWQVQGPVWPVRYGFEGGKPYRASYVPPASETDTGLLYTSSSDRHGRWWTACRPWRARKDAR